MAAGGQVPEIGPLFGVLPLLDQHFVLGIENAGVDQQAVLAVGGGGAPEEAFAGGEPVGVIEVEIFHIVLGLQQDLPGLSVLFFPIRQLFFGDVGADAAVLVAVVVQVCQLDDGSGLVGADGPDVVKIIHALLMGQQADNLHHLRGKFLGQILQGHSGVFHHIVKQCHGAGQLVGHGLCQMEGVVDIGEAGMVQLAVVGLICNGQGLFGHGGVDHKISSRRARISAAASSTNRSASTSVR